MNTLTKVGGFGAGLLLAAGGAFGVGHAVGPVGSDPKPAHGNHAKPPTAGTPEQPAAGQHAGHDPAAAPAAVQAPAPGGLQISERGYTLAPAADPIPVGAATDFRFRVLGPDGKPLTRYDRSHDKDLHLIVARRDLSGFQHVHPVLGADGTWSVPLTFAAAGNYRIFADFSPTGDPGGPLTLGADIAVAGAFEPVALPAPERTAVVDGYTVTLTGDLKAAESGLLTLTVSKDGRPVTDLQPYLGAFGHLVALRQGDLAYLHVHPQGAPGDGVTPAGPGVSFHAEAPSAGTYRLYLDFRHDGVVRTAEFTVNAANPGTTAPVPPAPNTATAPTPPSPSPEDHGAHAH
jgi:hypothetical protein